jgi:hypothetical protein
VSSVYRAINNSISAGKILGADEQSMCSATASVLFVVGEVAECREVMQPLIDSAETTELLI